MKDSQRMMLKFNFGLKKRIALYERLAAFLEAGINIKETIESIRNRYQKNKDSRAKILSEWLRTLEKGGKFGDAVKAWVPAGEHMLISAGERGEGLVHGLREATVLSAASRAIKSSIITGAAMPLFLAMMLTGMLIKFQSTMVPVFKSLLPVDQWPGSAQTLNDISGFLYHWWWISALIVGGTIWFIIFTMPKWKGAIRKKFDKFPPWSIYRTAEASSFMIGLSSLMKAGIASFDALKTMHVNSSPWMKEHLEKMMGIMRQGGPNSGRALNTGLLDSETAGDVEDYSRLGNFQDAIYLLGSRTLKDSVIKIDAGMAILRTVMLVMVASSIVWIYTTIYTLQSTIASVLSNHH